MSDSESAAQASAPAQNSAVEVTADVAGAIAQLRRLVCGLGAALIVVSGTFTAFVYKQNSNLSAVLHTREQQVQTLQQSQELMKSVAGELYLYAKTNSDLIAIFERHGLTPNVASGR